MDPTDQPAIRLCGRLEVARSGRDVSEQLPGRQGRLMLAYLARKRGRPVTRDELTDLLWPSDPPAHPDGVLGSLLSKLRRALGPGMIAGRHDLTLVLPDGERIDVEIAEDAIERAETALAAGDGGLAIAQAQSARELTEGGFLPGFDNPWVEERRREIEELRVRSLGCLAGAGLALGGARLGQGERAARELISVAPLSEPGYRLLMEILAKRGDVSAALQTYDGLRVQLRDELGIAPGPEVRALQERLLAGGDQIDRPAEDRAEPPESAQREERKLVAVVALELANAGTSDDPEDLRVANARLRERVRDEVERFGGIVETTGDTAAIAFFGALVGHEDDPERAIRAALRLCELGIAGQAGVATGEVLVAPNAVHGATATGRTIDDAVRLQRAAPPGGVVVDEQTVRATPRDAVAYDPVDQRMWVVQAASDRLAVPLEHPARTRFLGRETELGLLKALYASVVEHRRPSMVVALGHAGVGKSRLVDEFLKLGELPAPTVYRGRCLAYGEGTTYWALRQVLWAAAGIGFDDPAATAARKLRDRVGNLVPASEAERLAAALAIASGIALPDNALGQLTPPSVADEITLAWPAFLSGLAAPGPVIVVIEDLHWAEEPLLEILERMTARSKGPLLLVATARPELAERRPGWSARPGVSQISLEPLSAAVSRELVGELLPRAGAEIRERVAATAEGNPFFAEELARHVADDPGDLARVPNSVRAVLAARMDRLPDTEKRVLQDAAVVGRVFWAPTLESIEARSGLPEVLHGLEGRGLVVRHPTSSLPGQTELSFWHGLTREVAYRSIPRARRCRTHAAVGEWLERLAGDRRDEFIDLLAHHYEAASTPADVALAWPEGSAEPDLLRTKALAALIDAGEAARKRASTEQALRFAQRAQALATCDHERLAALEIEARSHHAAVRSDQALAAYTAAIELARKLGDTERVACLRAYATLLFTRYAGALTGDDWHPVAIKLIEDSQAEESGDTPTFERAALLLGRSIGLRRIRRSRQDYATAKRDAAEAVAIAETIESSELLAEGLDILYWLVLEEGFCEAEAMAERLVRASADSADRVEAHESKRTAAQWFAWAGRFDRAVEVAHEAMIEATGLSPHRALHSAMAQTYCLAPTGRFAELGDATKNVIELAEEDATRGACSAAVVAIAGRVLWLYESLESLAAGSALDFMNRIRPTALPKISWYFVADLLRPLVGIETTRSMLDSLPPPEDDAAVRIVGLRAQLPLLALGREQGALTAAIGDAHQLARSACAPALDWIADWAAAAQAARDDPAASLQHALAATTALARYGEAYTAARLMTEFLPLVDRTGVAELADKTAQRLTQMGALASAARARSAVDRI